MKKIILAIACMSLLSACANQVYKFEDQRHRHKETEIQNFFFFGVGQEDEFDALTVCEKEEDIVKIETAQKPLTAVISVLLAPIYTPRDVTVYCTN